MIRMRFFILAAVLFSSIAFLVPTHSASAQIVIPDKVKDEVGLSNGGGGDSAIFSTLTKVLGFITSIIAVLAILMIVWAGIMYITSGGSERRVDSAKEILVWAIGGLVVALLAQAIVLIIGSALGAGS